ncbi:MAG: hypothetical protein F6K39_03775 [Okeania sp. SIO3B3]|nr:hypothetical protein [Okeania sp. SIO3B3]
MHRHPIAASALLFSLFLLGTNLLTSVASDSNHRELFTILGNKPTPVATQYGLPIEDIQLLTAYYKPILKELPEDLGSLKAVIKDNLQKAFLANKDTLKKRYPGRDDRELLIISIVLSVNGSIPVYHPRPTLDRDLHSLLIDTQGNCSDYAIRLIMALDVFGIHGRMVTLFSKSLPGHMVVDAYDPSKKRAYLLDSNLNSVTRYQDTPMGFMDSLATLNDTQREALVSKSDTIIFLPLLLRYYVPGMFAYQKSSEVSAHLLNKQWSKRTTFWPTVLSKEAEEFVTNWTKANPPHRGPHDVSGMLSGVFPLITTAPPSPLTDRLRQD